MIRHIQLSEVDWHGIKESLPTGDSKYEEQIRNEHWKQFDPSENGLASLAECELAIRRIGGPLIPVYYAKKALLMAFNAAKQSVPGENSQKDDYIEKGELKEFMIQLKRYFALYYMFKKLDGDNNERLEMYDLIDGLMLMRQWGWAIKDMKEARKEFHKYDENNGGLLLFDEWCKFAEDQGLDIEKDSDIIHDNKRPRKVYKQHTFIRGGEKRPNQIDHQKWKSKVALVTLDKEIERMQKRNQRLARPEERQKQVLMKKDGRTEKDYGVIRYKMHLNTSFEREAEMTYEELEDKIKNIDDENYSMK